MKKLNKKILIEFPDVDIMCSATLLDEEEPELCDRFWKALEKPLKMICQNTLSTGDYFVALPRPPKHPLKVGSQANPIGRKRWLVSQLDPGMLVYSGCAMRVAYGPHVTEPLLAPGSVIAKVDEESIDDFLKAGKSVWNAQYMTHRLVTITFKRKEE
jgi:hypothetical protein